MTTLDEIKAEARRKKAAQACAKRLDAAINGMWAYMRACEACNDGSGSLSLQGKGVDGREKLVAYMAEFSGWLDSVYGERQP